MPSAYFVKDEFAMRLATTVAPISTIEWLEVGEAASDCEGRT
jgi:hypothetical protein